MATKKLREEAAEEDLNLLPIMNLICLLIPFLLLAAQFIKIGVLLIQTPTLSRPNPNDKQDPDKKPLNLTLVMTDKGYYLKSRYGAECPEAVGEDTRLCFRKIDGKFTPEVVAKLQKHLWLLFAKKYKSCAHYASRERDKCRLERHSIKITPEPTVKYSDLVRTLDAIRERPPNAKNPPLPGPIPSSGCTLEYDRKAQGYGVNDKTRDFGCMYYRVTLALGSS